MVAEIADALEVYDRTSDIRAIVLCAEGKHFCAGADFGSRGPDGVARATKPICTRRRSGFGAPASRSSPRCMALPWAPASVLR
jgi:enoyl-CoA hydratase/carnithine racemase